MGEISCQCDWESIFQFTIQSVFFQMQKNVLSISDNYITVFTPAKYDYVFLPGIRVNHRPYLTFKVKAKCDVHVALSTLYGDTENKTYEILIGGWNNTKSVIRDGSEGHIIEEALTPKILNQHMFRAFWIRWGRRNIEVGLGNKLGEKVFLRTFIPTDQQYHINSMGVTTGPGSPGQWELFEKIGRTFATPNYFLSDKMI